MTIRTVEISRHVMAQGDLMGFELRQHGADEYSVSPDRATVRTGQNTTATGRLIEIERTSDD